MIVPRNDAAILLLLVGATGLSSCLLGDNDVGTCVLDHPNVSWAGTYHETPVPLRGERDRTVTVDEVNGEVRVEEIDESGGTIVTVWKIRSKKEFEAAFEAKANR